jgi:hypothetical protein
MLEFVQLLHEAFHTESRWLFVLYVGLGSSLVFGILAAVLAFVVDTGYQRSLQEQHQNAASAQLTSPPPIVIKDTSEENRLRNEIQRLNSLLSTQKAQEATKRKREEIRTQLGNLMRESRAIMNSCLQPPTPNFSCEATAGQWDEKAAKYIHDNLEPSYLERFNSASGLSMSWTGMDQKTPAP